MSFNGSGVFVINSTGQPVVTNTTISSTVFNAFTADIATGLSTCLTKDGQSTATALIPFAQSLSTGSYMLFPAVQVPSANPNALDDYIEITWTPVLTCATPGNLTVAYSSQTGNCTKIGNLVTVDFRIVTSTFTWTTASGTVIITGLPYVAASTVVHGGGMDFGGLTKANYTNFVMGTVSSAASMNIYASGSGQLVVVCAIADFPTGGTVTLRGQLVYRV